MHETERVITGRLLETLFTCRPASADDTYSMASLRGVACFGERDCTEDVEMRGAWIHCKLLFSFLHNCIFELLLDMLYFYIFGDVCKNSA